MELKPFEEQNVSVVALSLVLRFFLELLVYFLSLLLLLNITVVPLKATVGSFLAMFFPNDQAEPTVLVPTGSTCHMATSMVLLYWLLAARTRLGVLLDPLQVWLVLFLLDEPFFEHLASCRVVVLLGTKEAELHSTKALYQVLVCKAFSLNQEVAMLVGAPLDFLVFLSELLAVPLDVALNEVLIAILRMPFQQLDVDRVRNDHVALRLRTASKHAGQAFMLYLRNKVITPTVVTELVATFKVESRV